MAVLTVCESPPLALDKLAGRIRASSNFRFDWQFYHYAGLDPRSPAGVRAGLEAIIASPDLYRFLADSFEPMYADAFSIDPLHEHCRVAPAVGDFENVLATAAGDHLGAYSRNLRDAKDAERRKIEKIFGAAGSYLAYQLLPGSLPGSRAV